MCLYSVTSGPEPEAAGVAYSVRTKTGQQYEAIHFRSEITYELGVEYEAVQTMIQLPLRMGQDQAQQYMSGFHLFETREDARRYAIEGDAILRTSYRFVLAKGSQPLDDGGPQVPAIVARYITHIAEVERIPSPKWSNTK